MPKTSATPTSAYLCVFQKLLELRIAIKSVWLTVEQATRIPDGVSPQGFLSSVKALCIMFRRIIDIENLYTLRYKDHGRVLHREEVRELRHRMGLLNVIDPLHPERSIRARPPRLRATRDGQSAVYLAIQEPGENWFGEEYRWGLEDKAVDGWEPLSWSEADTPDGKGGPAQSGRLRFDFVTESRRGSSRRRAKHSCNGKRGDVLAAARPLRRRPFCQTSKYIPRRPARRVAVGARSLFRRRVKRGWKISPRFVFLTPVIAISLFPSAVLEVFLLALGLLAARARSQHLNIHELCSSGRANRPSRSPKLMTARKPSAASSNQ